MENEDLKKYRMKFQKAKSPKEILSLYDKVLRLFPQRYKNTMYDWEERGLVDVINRRDFLIKNANGKVLDLGSSDGMFALRLAQSGRYVVGVDMLKKRIKLAKQKAKTVENCNFICDLIENIKYDGMFDTAIVSHVLEHSYNPLDILKIANKATKKNGKLIVILPPSIGNDPTHLRYIASAEIRKMLSNFGKCTNKILVGPKSYAYICQK